MNQLWLLAASGFMLGILGSFHCVGMCGPLALSLPVHRLNGVSKYLAIALYHIGRSSSYAFLGAIVGSLGVGISLFGWQQYLSIFAGVLILLGLVQQYLPRLRSTWLHRRFYARLNPYLSHLLTNARHPATYFLIGWLNGWLPCGLTYVALAAAVATGSNVHSAWLMFAFGMGTTPMMASIMIFGKYIPINIKQRINRLLPYAVASVAILLIVRGMGLGIPYISPSIDLHNGKCAVSCCHQAK